MTDLKTVRDLDNKWRNGIEAAIGVANDRQTIIENLVTLCERMNVERDKALDQAMMPVDVDLQNVIDWADGVSGALGSEYANRVTDQEAAVAMAIKGAATNRLNTGWQDISTAPRDGTPIWAYLNHTGIKKMRWDDGDNEYQPAWVEFDDPTTDWSPKFWMPYSEPPASEESDE